MASYAIIKVGNVATPVSYTYGANTAGTGTITTFTGNTTVIGNGTIFTTQLGNNYAIRNSAGTYIGKIANITSNTAATLTKNSVSAVTAGTFIYQAFNYTVLATDPHTGNGNISTFSANNTVIGTNTTFLTQLDLGYQLFDSTDGNLIGIVKTITSNTAATLTTVSGYPAANIGFRLYDPNTKNNQTANVFNVNGHYINAALLNWSKSGLIAGVTQVKSYHPPVPDPLTGVLVNFPATIHTINQIGNVVLHNYANNHVMNQSNFSTVETFGVVKDFNEDNGIIGSSTNKATKSIPINGVLNRLIDSGATNVNVSAVINTIYGPPSLPNNPGVGYGIVLTAPPVGFTQVVNLSAMNPLYTTYIGPGANTVYVINSSVTTTALNTASDILSSQANHPPPARVIDRLTDAQQYFSATDEKQTLSDAEKSDLAARASDRFTPNGPKQMTSTGIPASIPGQLNVILTDQDPANRKYIPPTYDTLSAQNDFFNFYNPDIPISNVNIPPFNY